MRDHWSTHIYIWFNPHWCLISCILILLSVETLLWISCIWIHKGAEEKKFAAVCKIKMGSKRQFGNSEKIQQFRCHFHYTHYKWSQTYGGEFEEWTNRYRLYLLEFRRLTSTSVIIFLMIPLKRFLSVYTWPFLCQGSVPNCGMSFHTGHGVPFHMPVLLLPLLVVIVLIVVSVVMVVMGMVGEDSTNHGGEVWWPLPAQHFVEAWPSKPSSLDLSTASKEMGSCWFSRKGGGKADVLLLSLWACPP